MSHWDEHAPAQRGVYKKTRVKNPAIFKRFRALIHQCERCGANNLPADPMPDNPLEIAHIKARGMGGGSRRDTEDNLVLLHRSCHREHGHGRTMQNRNYLLSLVERRPEWVREELRRG